MTDRADPNHNLVGWMHSAPLRLAAALSLVGSIWEGFIFIHLGIPTESLHEYLGGVVDQLGGGHFD